MAYNTMTNRAAGYTVTEADWDIITDNMDVINARFLRLRLEESIPPISGIDPASLEIGESTDAGTVHPHIYHLDFEDSTDSGRIWGFRVPRDFGGNPAIVGSYYMAGAQSSKAVCLVAQVACISDGDSYIAKGFSTANSVTESVPDTAGESDEFSVTITNADSMAANDWCNLLLYRDADDSSDTATDDWCMTSIAFHYTLASS